MDELSEIGSGAKARAWNFALLGAFSASLIGKTAYLGVKTILSPIEIPIHLGARLTKHFIREGIDSENRKIDKPGHATRRKICRALPSFIKNSSTLSHIASTILKIAKLVVALFSTLVIGFISVDANLLFLHKIGLIQLPQYAKEDRKKSILDTVRKLEGDFDKKQAERFEDKVTKEGTLLLREQIYGNNQFIGLDESDHVWDAQALLRKNLKTATEERRKKSREQLKELKEEKGETLTDEEFEKNTERLFRHSLKICGKEI